MARFRHFHPLLITSCYEPYAPGKNIGTFLQQIAARWNSLDDKSDYIEKEENDRRRYFLEKTTDSLNSIFKMASAPSDPSEDHSSDTNVSSKSGSSQHLVVSSLDDLEDVSEIEIPRTPRNTAIPVMTEDSLDDIISDEESTICDERPKLSDYTIPNSIDTEAIFATISDYSKFSNRKCLWKRSRRVSQVSEKEIHQRLQVYERVGPQAF